MQKSKVVTKQQHRNSCTWIWFMTFSMYCEGSKNRPTLKSDWTDWITLILLCDHILLSDQKTHTCGLCGFPCWLLLLSTISKSLEPININQPATEVDSSWLLFRWLCQKKIFWCVVVYLALQHLNYCLDSQSDIIQFCQAPLLLSGKIELLTWLWRRVLRTYLLTHNLNEANNQTIKTKTHKDPM